MNSTRDIDALIDMMAKLPGLGPRSARRAVLHLIPQAYDQLGDGRLVGGLVLVGVLAFFVLE